MSSELLEQIIAGMPLDFAAPGDDHESTRTKMAPLHGHPLAPETSARFTEVGGVRAAWLSLTGSDAHRDAERGPGWDAVLFCHGGAFVSCDLEAYLFYAEYVAEWVGAPVLTVDYRLAPEHPFPAAVDDCLAAYRGLLDQGAHADRLLVVGDSCGGGLALAAVVGARDAGLPLPAGVVSLSGWVDLDTCGYGPGRPEGHDPFITEGFLRDRARDYLGPAQDPRAPAASPARADLIGLPPLFLQAGENDLCRRDAEQLCRRARSVGVDARVDVVAGGVHGVQGLVNLGVPEAVAAWKSVRRFSNGLLPGGTDC